jgi:predicted DsbA family dithiol-disulfide isomerase
MKITFYHSILCPRCLLVGRALSRLQEEHPDLVIDRVEVTMRPAECLRRGIRMIPALTAEDGRKLSGLVVTPAMVRDFVAGIYGRAAMAGNAQQPAGR